MAHGTWRENIMIEQIGGDFLQWLRGFYYRSQEWQRHPGGAGDGAESAHHQPSDQMP